MVRIISTRSEKFSGQNVGLSSDSQLFSRSGGGVAGAPALHPLLPGGKNYSGVRGEPFVAPAPSDCSDAPNPLAPPGTRGTSLSLRLRTERLPWTSPSLSSPLARSLSPLGPLATASAIQPRAGGKRQPLGVRVAAPREKERGRGGAATAGERSAPGGPGAPPSFCLPSRDCSGFPSPDAQPLNNRVCLSATRPPGWDKGRRHQLGTHAAGVGGEHRRESKKICLVPGSHCCPFDVLVRRAHAPHIRITALGRLSWISSLQ